MIERLIIHNFKGIKSADIQFQSYKNGSSDISRDSC